jgi:TetR/AcrR family fatty acid metabolism transcriptional regulator
MAKTPDPIQEMVTAARRKQILDAATQVFAEKGFHRATIKDVAKASGVADGTIYNYFDNKTDLLIALLDRLNESERREVDLASGPDQDVRSFFVNYVRHRIAVLWSNHQVMQAVLPELISNPELRRRYHQQVIEPTMRIGEQFFQTQMEQGHLRKVNPALAARTFAGSILGLLVLQMLDDHTLAARLDALPEVLASLFFDGLLPTDDASSDTKVPKLC